MAGRQRRIATTDPVREAVAHVRAINRTLARHFTMCFRCSRAGLDTGDYCDEGWQLAKQRARAQAAEHRARNPQPARPLQGTLW